MAHTKLCEIQGCGKPARSPKSRLCNSHHMREWRHGSPLIKKGSDHGEAVKFMHEVVIPYCSDDCLIWPCAKDAAGYGQVYFDGRARYVSRVVCEEVNGHPPTSAHEAAHNCGKGHLGCVNPKHLRWATRKENAEDRLIHGTHHRGERSHFARLTSEAVKEIRQLRGALRQHEIAERFGVSQQTVSRILARQTWNLPGEQNERS